MRTFVALLLGAMWLATAARAQSPPFVIDDEAYEDKVTAASAKLLHGGKLKSSESMRRQVHSRGASVRLAPVGHDKVAAPDLYERLRESTLAVGAYYKCPDCGKWHFNSSAGFVVGPGGIISTCCHVVLGEEEDVKESYLVAADSTGRVFPVESVVAADTEADTCFLKIDAANLKPLPLRTGVRPGERVYCLSHPGGYHFMFTEGLVARLNRKRNEVLDEHGQTNGLLTRPILFLNVTAEFAPGSSGAAIVDEAGNVVAQVASIADAGDPGTGDDKTAPSPSVPVRFCTASEEILRLAEPRAEGKPEGRIPKPRDHAPKADGHKPRE